MSAGTIFFLLAVLVGIIVLVVVLARPGFPETKARHDDDSEGDGPTGEEYPPGARPAGPGAETMSIEPSETMGDEKHV